VRALLAALQIGAIEHPFSAFTEAGEEHAIRDSRELRMGALEVILWASPPWEETTYRPSSSEYSGDIRPPAPEISDRRFVCRPERTRLDVVTGFEVMTRHGLPHWHDSHCAQGIVIPTDIHNGFSIA